MNQNKQFLPSELFSPSMLFCLLQGWRKQWAQKVGTREVGLRVQLNLPCGSCARWAANAQACWSPHPCCLDTGYRAMGLKAHPVGFGFCFVPISPFYATPSFWNDYVYSVLLWTESIMLVYSVAHGRELVLSLRRDFELGLFFKDLFNILFFICVYASVWVYVCYVSAEASGNQKREPEILN